jgi:predicted HicB family RNase H-like nuclease
MHIGKHTYIALTLTIFSAYPTVVAADELPQAFRGAWGATTKECNPKAPESENQVKVSAKTLIEYESSCKLKKIKSSSTTSLEGTFTCSVEGENSTVPIKMSLLEDGKVLILRDTKLMRCK